MKLENQVCSLEISMRLKELGIKQESIFLWEYFDEKCYSVKFNPYAVVPNTFNNWKVYSAFTAQELLEIIPENIDHGYLSVVKANIYCVRYELTDIKYYPNKNLADSCAYLLIYLIENNLMEIKK